MGKNWEEDQVADIEDESKPSGLEKCEWNVSPRRHVSLLSDSPVPLQPPPKQHGEEGGADHRMLLRNWPQLGCPTRL